MHALAVMKLLCTIFFFENNYGAKPPSNKYINQKEKLETYKKPQRGREGRRRRLTSS
jgi:hypothetical protein